MPQFIEILSADVETKRGTSTKTGKQYEIREQAAALHTSGKKYPEMIRFPVGRDSQGYPVGMYAVETSLAVGSFERLERARDIGLVPVKAKQ